MSYNTSHTPPVTAEELYHMKDRLDGARYELYKGELQLCESTGLEHAGIGVELSSYLASFVREKQLGRVFGADGTYILARNPDTVRSPDVSFVNADRLGYGRLTPKFFEGAPDLAVEIMSPNDRFASVDRKIYEYIQAGTQLVWVIRPLDYSAIIYHATGLVTKLSAQAYLDGEEVLPNFTLRLGLLFAA